MDIVEFEDFLRSRRRSPGLSSSESALPPLFQNLRFEDLDDGKKCALAKHLILIATPRAGVLQDNGDARVFVRAAAREFNNWPQEPGHAGRRLQHITYALSSISEVSFPLDSPSTLASVYILHQLEFCLRVLGELLHPNGVWKDQAGRERASKKIGESFRSRVDGIDHAFEIAKVFGKSSACACWRELDEEYRAQQVPSNIRPGVAGRLWFMRNPASHGQIGDVSAEGFFYSLLIAIGLYGSDLIARE